MIQNRLRALVRVTLAAFALSVTTANVMAEEAVMVIVTDPAQVNHYPGPDGLVATSDDVVSSSLTAVQGSAPNAGGSYGFNAFKFSQNGPDDPSLPTGTDAITFVNGIVTVDKDVFFSGGGAIISAMNLTSGTEPFPGHGAYTSTITAVNSGTYDIADQEFALNVDFEYTIFGSTASEPGVDLSGTAIYQSADEFVTDSLDDYFENVVKPLAQARGATGAVYITGSGQLTSLGYPIRFTVVALEGVGFTINAGLNDAWGIEGVENQGLFITVYEDFEGAFIAMFTYDSQAPTGGEATLGAIDQRWLTAFGSIAGNTISASAEFATGGLFNMGLPDPTLNPGYGTFTIEFADCNHGTMTYELPGPGLSGQMKLFRFLEDNVPYCIDRGYD